MPHARLGQKLMGDYVFADEVWGASLSTRQYARLVSIWIASPGAR